MFYLFTFELVKCTVSIIAIFVGSSYQSLVVLISTEYLNTSLQNYVQNTTKGQQVRTFLSFNHSGNNKTMIIVTVNLSTLIN